MRLEELDFEFPEELIAQYPAEPRDGCRLLHLRPDGSRGHERFCDLPGLLRPGDTVVFNNSRVLPARMAAKKPTGGKVELLFLRTAPPAGPSGGNPKGEDDPWEVLAKPSHRLKVGGHLLLEGGEQITLCASLGEGRWRVQVTSGESVVALMHRYGTLPLPPYIRGYGGDPDAYQTVYALHLGSAAAPTAGLHFTPEILDALCSAGIGSADVTLHVGLDTFQSVREEIVEEHRIHRERYSVPGDTLRVLRATKARGGRLVAVGTTAARVLETLASRGILGEECGGVEGETEIFITPGYRFRAVDVLLTNFHLPRSTVLALVMAFAGTDRIRDAYKEAVDLRYRLFSFGDAMLIEAPDEVTNQCGGGG